MFGKAKNKARGRRKADRPLAGTKESFSKREALKD